MQGLKVMKLTTFLKKHQESIPPWLRDFQEGCAFDREGFFSSRIVFYPGSGTDGHPVKEFGSSHCAHCFVYVDYHHTRTDIRTELARPNSCFRGYYTLSTINLGKKDLPPNSWRADGYDEDYSSDDITSSSCIRRGFPPSKDFGLIDILERNPDLDDSHGAKRLAIMFLGTDGYAAYDFLFCRRRGASPPFAVVLQDHGWGGNYSRFGKRGLLEKIASTHKVFPPYLLVASRNTKAWTGYDRLWDVNGSTGGMHHSLRHLFTRVPESTSDTHPTTVSF